MSLTHEIAFTLNGVQRRASVDVEMNALQMLREVIGLSGTKYACGEGECGACSVIVDGRSVNSCLLFAVDCDGREITTVEGLAGDPRAQALQREVGTERGQRDQHHVAGPRQRDRRDAVHDGEGEHH